MAVEESCPACSALIPEQKIQLSVPSYKQKKEKKKEKSEKVKNMDKLVDPSSVSIFSPATSDNHVELMDTSDPSHSSTNPDAARSGIQEIS